MRITLHEWPDILQIVRLPHCSTLTGNWNHCFTTLIFMALRAVPVIEATEYTSFRVVGCRLNGETNHRNESRSTCIISTDVLGPRL